MEKRVEIATGIAAIRIAAILQIASGVGFENLKGSKGHTRKGHRERHPENTLKKHPETP